MRFLLTMPTAVYGCSSDSSTRPGDMFHPDFEQACPTFFDIEVRNSLQPLYIIQAAHLAGAAQKPVRGKKNNHDAQVTATGSIFHPLVWESLGLWSPRSLQLLKTIARRLSFKGNLMITVSQATNNVHEQLSVKLWLCNAKMVLQKFALDCRDSIFSMSNIFIYPPQWVSIYNITNKYYVSGK